MMRLCELRRKCAQRLKSVCGDCAAFDADLLIEAACGIPRRRFVQMADTQVDDKAANALISRRIDGEPTQYILGEWEFYGLPFYVGEGVLIPRQDTEVLVERALSLIADVREPRVLDLCSGSGCIAVAIADKRRDASVTAVELYSGATDYLSRNIARNGVSVEIRQCDVLCAPDGFGTYDLIVSNPPYINADDMRTLPPEVAREPHTALYGGADGLRFYRAIAENWLPLLAHSGSAAVEIGYDQAQSVSEIFLSHGMTAQLEKDYAGIDRVIYGTVKDV